MSVYMGRLWPFRKKKDRKYKESVSLLKLEIRALKEENRQLLHKLTKLASRKKCNCGK